MSKAKILVDEATQKIQRLNLFTTMLFGNKEDLKEDIVELLYRASEQYNISQDYENSIICLEKLMKYAKEQDLSRYAHDLIKIYVKLKNFDKIESLIETYFPPDKITNQTIKILSAVINEFIENDEFDKAEKYLLMGEQYSVYLDATTNILNFRYIRANLYLKYSSPKYHEASNLLMDLGKEYLQNQMVSSKSIPIFAKAIIIQLTLNDIIKADEYYKIVSECDYKFVNSREGKFVFNILNCVKNFDSVKFMEHIEEYDKITPLEPTLVSLLLVIKNNFNQVI